MWPRRRLRLGRAAVAEEPGVSLLSLCQATATARAAPTRATGPRDLSHLSVLLSHATASRLTEVSGMVITVMTRDQSMVRRSFPSPLVVAGWMFTAMLPVAGLVRGPTRWEGWLVLGPAVGIVLGSMAITKPGATRTQGTLILAVSLVGTLMWGLTLAGVGGSLLLTS